MLSADSDDSQPITKPQLLSRVIELDTYLKTLSANTIAKVMGISKPLSLKTKDLITDWTSQSNKQRPAVDCFLGDIYSGLQANSWTSEDRVYANNTLRILSGLYGILRPSDGIYPYRLEMGCRLPNKKYSSLYKFWGESIANTLSGDGPIINLSAVEYSRVISDFVDPKNIITPSFYTVNHKTNKPAFVTVHTKIARGAFANWLITNKASNTNDLASFNKVGYTHDPKLSKPNAPAFVAKEFAGKGLSIRLGHQQ